MNYYLFSTASKSVFEDVCKYHYLIRSDSATRNILNKDNLHLILDLFDPNSQFKDLTDIEIVNILLDIFICDDKLKYVDDNKYKDLSNKIKTIINKRNKG